MSIKKLRFSEIIFGILIVLILLPANIIISKSEVQYSGQQLNPGFKPQQLRAEDLKPVDLSMLDNSTLWLQNAANGDDNFKEVQNSFVQYWETHKQGKGSGWKPFKRTEYFWKLRTGSGERITGNKEQETETGGVIPNLTNIYKDLLEKQAAESRKQKEDAKNDKVQEENEWAFLGPLKKPEILSYMDPSGLGRINCIAFHPRNPKNLWAGSAFGGVWHSINGGGTWETFPFTNFMSIGISDIAIANVSNTYTNIIYAATGDADAAFGGINNFSIGVIKSNDNGKNWKITNFSSQISDRILINRLIIDPRDTNHVYAATTRGLFVTEDGGDTWDTLTQAYTRDLEFIPDQPNSLWAAFLYGDGQNSYYGLFRVDIIQRAGKDSVTFNSTPINYNYGDVIRMAVAVNSENPNYVYILSATNGGGLHSVIYTPNEGLNWYYMAQTIDNTVGNYFPDLLNARSDEPDSITTASQGQYDLCIAANPDDPMDVYIGGVNIWRYMANNGTWELHGYWTSKYEDMGAPFIHADHHDLKFNDDGELYSANDGGLYRFDAKSDDWIDVSDGLAVTQFYRINGARTDPGLVICGSQDNGTSILRNRNWYSLRGGDGMDCNIDPFDSQVLYNSIYYGDFDVSRNGGGNWSHLIDTVKTKESAEWVTPMAIDPVIPDNIYVGYKNLWKATRKGLDPFQKISNFTEPEPIRHIAISKENHDVIYVIKPQVIYRTTDAGKSWKSVITGNGDLVLTSIAIDPKDPLHFWVTRGAFVENEKVLEYIDGGIYRYSDGLPNVPVSCIVHNRNSTENQMFIGTDVGVYFIDDKMPQWEPYGKGLPNVVIQDLEIHYASGKLRAGTFGRGLWEVKILDCVIPAPELELNGSNKICAGDTLTIKVKDKFVSYAWSTGDTTNSIRVWQSGQFSVTVKDSNGCVAVSEDIQVTLVQPPDIKVKNNDSKTSFCYGDSLRLDASPSFYYDTFLWSNGATGKTIYVYESGTYTVVGTTKEGCKKTSEAFVATELESPEEPLISQEGNVLTSTEDFEYQWYFNGQRLVGGTKRTLTVKNSGYYKVLVTNQDGCTHMSDEIYVEVVGVDGREHQMKQINLQPNPATDGFNINISNIENESVGIEITNIIGTTVLKIPPQMYDFSFEKDVNIRLLPDGFYFVNISVGSEKFVIKFVKQ